MKCFVPFETKYKTAIDMSRRKEFIKLYDQLDEEIKQPVFNKIMETFTLDDIFNCPAFLEKLKVEVCKDIKSKMFKKLFMKTKRCMWVLWR